MDLIPKRADNGLVLAGICGTLVHRLPDVDAVVQELVNVALVDKLALFPGDALRPQRVHQRGGRTQFDDSSLAVRTPLISKYYFAYQSFRTITPGQDGHFGALEGQTTDGDQHPITAVRNGELDDQLMQARKKAPP